MRAPTVLIVDDHDTFRMLARDLLCTEGFDVVAEASDGASGIEAARRVRPDVVLLDVQLPDMDGFAVARELALDEQPPPIVLTSSRSRSDYGPQVGSSGALGFIPKDELSGAGLLALLTA